MPRFRSNCLLSSGCVASDSRLQLLAGVAGVRSGMGWIRVDVGRGAR